MVVRITLFFKTVFADIEINTFLANSVTVGIALSVAVSAKRRWLLLVREWLFFYYVLASILELQGFPFILILFLFFHLVGKIRHLFFNYLFHDGYKGMMFSDIFRPRTLSAFFMEAAKVSNFIYSEAFEAFICLCIWFCMLMMNWFIHAEISEIGKLPTCAAWKLFKWQNIHSIGWWLARSVFVTEIKWLCKAACVRMHVHFGPFYWSYSIYTIINYFRQNLI